MARLRNNAISKYANGSQTKHAQNTANKRQVESTNTHAHSPKHYMPHVLWRFSSTLRAAHVLAHLNKRAMPCAPMFSRAIAKRMQGWPSTKLACCDVLLAQSNLRKHFRVHGNFTLLHPFNRTRILQHLTPLAKVIFTRWPSIRLTFEAAKT